MAPPQSEHAPLFDWLSSRSAGVLLHPTSLPGPQGVGTLGDDALRFVEFLQSAGMSWWQVCPLGPTGYGDSPYQCYSAFAGNPHLIDLRSLVSGGLLNADEIAPLALHGAGAVDFSALSRLKQPLLRLAARRHRSAGSPALGAEGFADFKAAQAPWLPAYAWFRALKDHFGGAAWWDWPERARSYASMPAALRRQLGEEAEAHQFYQYAFFAQWRRDQGRGREAARDRGHRRHPDLRRGRLGGRVGLPRSSLSSARTGGRSPSQAFPPITSPMTASSGEIPSTGGRLHAATGYAWWKERLRSLVRHV
jgi:4-alpha-glucanotransferase